MKELDKTILEDERLAQLVAAYRVSETENGQLRRDLQRAEEKVTEYRSGTLKTFIPWVFALLCISLLIGTIIYAKTRNKPDAAPSIKSYFIEAGNCALEKEANCLYVYEETPGWGSNRRVSQCLDSPDKAIEVREAFIESSASEVEKIKETTNANAQ